MKRKAVQIGQHYLSVEGGYFGGPGPEWEVVSVTELNDGVGIVRLTGRKLMIRSAQDSHAAS